MVIELRTLEAVAIWDQEDRKYVAIELRFGGYPVARWPIPEEAQYWFDLEATVDNEVSEFVASKLKGLFDAQNAI